MTFDLQSYSTASFCSSKALLRQLATLSHFSRLLGQAEAVAREQGIAGEIHSDFLFLAPPLEIPWSDVAIHVVNCPVSVLSGKLGGRERIKVSAFWYRIVILYKKFGWMYIGWYIHQTASF